MWNKPKSPPEEPKMAARSGRSIRLKMRVYRAKEDRWYDLPEEVHTLEGEPR